MVAAAVGHAIREDGYEAVVDESEYDKGIEICGNIDVGSFNRDMYGG